MKMKKLWRVLGLTLLGIIFCAGCKNRQPIVISSAPPKETAETMEKTMDKADSQSAQATLPASPKDGGQPFSEQERYRAILLDDEAFICTDLQNEGLNIGEIKKAVTDDEDIAAAATKFAVIDLNGDGENEIVLWIQINGVSDYGFEILRSQENAVYGYTLPYRAFMNLKTDGTFIFSGGAADSGVGKLRFSGDGYAVDKLYYSESGYDANNELNVQYFTEGNACQEEEFLDAMARQEDKPDVRWYDLTDRDVAIAFEN